MALMLASTILDRDDSMSPSAAERSRCELAGRDCTAQGVVSGGQEVGPSRQGVETTWRRVERSRQGGMESRLLGTGSRLG